MVMIHGVAGLLYDYYTLADLKKLQKDFDASERAIAAVSYTHLIDDARKFSRLRVAPMIRDSKPLKAKVHDVKAKDSGNTILQKSFPGGMLTLTGSNSASALASTPARYIIGDERDRWATSAGIFMIIVLHVSAAQGDFHM